MEQPTRAEIEDAIQYHHPEKTLASLPGGQEIGATLLAPFFATDARTYQEIRAAFTERARRCARELLADEWFARLVDQLPFEDGSTVVGLGDSITDDLQSWLEILRHLLAERRPGIEVVNAGISGDTSSGLLGRFLDVLERDPAWVVILIGTNDVASIREPATKSLVSLRETGNNLRALRNLAKSLSNTRLAWVTPPLAIEERTTDVPAGQPVWRNADLAEAARLVREVAGEDPLVDLWEAFGNPPKSEFLFPDGLHPSLTGQKAIATTLVRQLSNRP